MKEPKKYSNPDRFSLVPDRSEDDQKVEGMGIEDRDLEQIVNHKLKHQGYDDEKDKRIEIGSKYQSMEDLVTIESHHVIILS
jgi:hypothetical protein